MERRAAKWMCIHAIVAPTVNIRLSVYAFGQAQLLQQHVDVQQGCRLILDCFNDWWDRRAIEHAFS